MPDKPKYVGFGELHSLDKSGRPQEKWTATGGRPHAGHNSEITQVVDGHISETSPVCKNKDRHSKNKIKRTIRYSLAIDKQIQDFCAKHKLHLQDFHELAVAHYMASVDGHKTANTVNVDGHNFTKWPSHDDLMIFKTHDDIIMRYERLTGRKWKPSDDRAATPFNNIDHQLIEIGMIHTYIQAKGKRINSFAYFIPEIQTMIDANFDRSNLGVYLKARRKLLLNWMKKQGKEPIAFWDSEEKKQEG
jgi:hypothetical protein